MGDGDGDGCGTGRVGGPVEIDGWDKVILRWSKDVDHRPGWPKSWLSESGYAKIVIFVFAQAHNRHGIGQIIADHMRANRKDYGIWYVIWNRRIASQATPAAAGGPRERHVRPYAAEKRNLAEAIAELPEIVNGHDDVLAEAAGITGGSLYAWPSLTLGMS